MLRQGLTRRLRGVGLAARARILERYQVRNRAVQGFLRFEPQGLRNFDQQRVDGAPLECQSARIFFIVDEKLDGRFPNGGAR